MTYRQQVFALAAKLNAKIEIDLTGGFTARIEAPVNHHWSDGLHEFVAFQYTGFNTNDLWKDLLYRMQYGIEECNNECEWWES